MSVSADSYGLHPDRLYACTLSRFRSFMFICGCKARYISPFFSFIGSVLFLTAGCLFHMHRQIMFVNYLPFLILAFLCVKKRKFRFLPLCMLLICLHSFYFAIAAFAAIGWYWLRTEKETCLEDSFSKNISLPPFFPYAWRRRSFCRQDLY